MYDILRICEIKRPKYIFLENVKGFSTKRYKPTFDRLKETLRQFGYGDLQFAILNTKDYGIPQNRERLWMFAQLGGLPENFSMTPPPIQNNKRLKDFIDDNPADFLYLSQKQIQRIKDFYGIPSFIVDEPSCFDLYNKKIRSDGLSITILAPEHNKMRIVEPPINGLERVRKYSVQEQFRLMGFEDGEVNFANQSYTQLSKRAANGWDVNLVGILLNHIWRQLL